MTLEEKLNEFKAEGIAEGKKKKAIETAKNLLLMTDFSIDKISLCILGETTVMLGLKGSSFSIFLKATTPPPTTRQF